MWHFKWFFKAKIVLEIHVLPTVVSECQNAVLFESLGLMKKSLHFSICACHPCAGAMLLKIKTMSAECAEFQFIWWACKRIQGVTCNRYMGQFSGLTAPPSSNSMPPKVSMSVVNQITRLPGLLNFNWFSPHAFHLDKKVEVFAAEGSPNHESPGQLKLCRRSAPNHQFTLANQAY